MSVTGIILAGGASSRMGRPKALLLYERETFLERLTRILLAQCEQVIIVLGFQPETIWPSVPEHPHVHVALNPDYTRGQLSSLQSGLASAPDRPAYIYTPVDIPAVQDSTVARLIESETHNAQIVIPQYQGRHGHPILFKQPIAAELIALPADATARQVMHRHRDSTLFVDVEDSGILHDVDTPADYAELTQ